MQLPPPSMPPQQRSPTTDLEPNVAALLSYLILVPPITAVIFLLIEKEDRFVRFHAMQSVIFGAAGFLAIMALQVIGAILSAISTSLGIAFAFLTAFLGIGIFGLWVLLLIKAYQGQAFKLPVIGDEAARRV